MNASLLKSFSDELLLRVRKVKPNAEKEVYRELYHDLGEAHITLVQVLNALLESKKKKGLADLENYFEQDNPSAIQWKEAIEKYNSILEVSKNKVHVVISKELLKNHKENLFSMLQSVFGKREIVILHNVPEYTTAYYIEINPSFFKQTKKAQLFDLAYQSKEIRYTLAKFLRAKKVIKTPGRFLVTYREYAQYEMLSPLFYAALKNKDYAKEIPQFIKDKQGWLERIISLFKVNYEDMWAMRLMNLLEAQETK